MYVAIQGETTVIGCGECKKRVNLNDYITSVSVEASVDSPPGSATISLTIPDNDVNNFYVENQFMVIPMMEVEIYAKGYYLVGGLPQYYKVFWGLVSSVQSSWSNGVTSISIQCRDILRWWELTQTVLSTAWLNPTGTSTQGWQMYANQFAAMNPIAVVIQLAREAMGDFMFTTGSFGPKFTPENGIEKDYTSSTLTDVMVYWQAKFGRIWNNFVIYGASGQLYTTNTLGATVSPIAFSQKIFESEFEFSKNQSQESNTLRTDVAETAFARQELSRAADVDFFQTNSKTKLEIALEARDQIGYEFYCDTTGEIIFKPPFFNLNVLPNKPVSWIQNFELIEDSITDSEAEVVTHMTGSANAYGGLMDVGLNDEITAANTGVFDYHLLRRYGWRKHEQQSAWASNAKKLFFYLVDLLDRINAKRVTGNFQIPMRPELRMGFPIYVEKYDSFFYITAISHSYSVGGSATTTVTVSGKRGKFIAPKNIGIMERGQDVEVPVRYVFNGPKPKGAPKPPTNPDGKTATIKIPSYKVSFPDGGGTTTGQAYSQSENPGPNPNEPVILRHPKTGKLLGYPNVVMVFRKTLSGETLAKALLNAGAPVTAAVKTDQKKSKDRAARMSQLQSDVVNVLQNAERQQLIGRIRQHRYEAAATNAGIYDYAWDKSGLIKEFQMVPAESIVYSTADGSAEPITQTAASKQASANLSKNIVTAKKAVAAASTASAEAAKTKKEDPAKSKAAEEALKKANANLNALLKRQEVSESLPSLQLIIRPVSDEFGFEVVGHYRYGRASKIDLDRLAKNDSPTNNLTVQFAPTGNLLTDSVSTPTSASGDSSPSDFAKSLEKMTTEDWQTGATFTNLPVTGPVTIDTTSVTLTSRQTFNDMKSGNGNTAFVEADAVLSAKALTELSPTVDNSGLSQFVADCSCGLGRPNWINVLPTSVIESIVNGSSDSTYAKSSKDARDSIGNSPIAEVLRSSSSVSVDESRSNTELFSSTGDEGSKPVAFKGNITSGQFFAALNAELRKSFSDRLKANNGREQRYTQGNVPVEINGINTNEVDPTFKNYTPQEYSLFQAAANGDISALKTLNNNPNWNFGLTPSAFEKMKTGIDNAVTAFKRSVNNTPDSPSFSQLINPGYYDAAGGSVPPVGIDPSKTPK
jgi:hypothetical protein